MYKRFRDSIVFPRNIIEYRNDSLFKVFSYIIFFALLLSTSTILYTVTFDGIENSTIEMVKSDINTLDESCKIDEAVFDCDTNKNQLFYNFAFYAVYFDSRPDLVNADYESMYNIVFNNDKVHVIFNKTIVYSMPISELPLTFQNINFDEHVNDPDSFYMRIFEAVDDLLLETKGMWAPAIIITDFLTSFALFMLFIIVSAWMLKIRFKPIRFRHLFTMAAYSGTALFLILIFNSLINLSFFIVILLVFVAIRQNNQLGLEIMKRTSKKP